MEQNIAATETGKERMLSLRDKHGTTGLTVEERQEFIALASDVANFMGMTRERIRDILYVKSDLTS